MDEGTADYWAAVVLGTPDIYSWQHVAESMDDRDITVGAEAHHRRLCTQCNPHRNGNIWASALWDVRSMLEDHMTDLLVMKTLVLFSKVGSKVPAPALSNGSRRTASRRPGHDVKADELLYQGKNRARC